MLYPISPRAEASQLSLISKLGAASRVCASLLGEGPVLLIHSRLALVEMLFHGAGRQGLV